MDYIFDICINLKFVNFLIPHCCISFLRTKFMPNNCISLTSIYLSNF